MAGLTAYRTLPYGGYLCRWRGNGNYILDFFGYNLAICVSEMPTCLLIQVVDRRYRTVVSSVADLIQNLVCHDVRTPKVFDTGSTIGLDCGFSSPIVNP